MKKKSVTIVWRMTTIQNYEQNGDIIACGTGEPQYAELPVLTLLCNADHGSLTLTDLSNHETYMGTYTIVHSDNLSTMYHAAFDTVEGMAVTSATKYSNDERMPTLMIRLGEYTMNFFPENSFSH